MTNGCLILSYCLKSYLFITKIVPVQLNLRAFIIVLIIVASLLPAYVLYQYLARRMRPKESLARFAGWMLTVFVLILAYTFLLVFLIKLLFPGA